MSLSIKNSKCCLLSRNLVIIGHYYTSLLKKHNSWSCNHSPSIDFSHRQHHTINSMSNSGDQWRIEKNRWLLMTTQERRNFYKSDYIALDVVVKWKDYVAKHQSIKATKVPIEDDVTEFKKIKLVKKLNEKLASKVSIYEGDITKLEVDAIVNAANSMLQAGGGVDGAIHRAAGPYLQCECNFLNGCPVGEAKVTGGFDLPAKYVIHTVGPQNGNAEHLETCYKKCLAYQRQYGLKSMAFPCISTGVYGFPNRLAAHIALRNARQFLETNEDIERIIFCLFMPIDIDIYKTIMQLYFPVD